VNLSADPVTRVLVDKRVSLPDNLTNRSPLIALCAAFAILGGISALAYISLQGVVDRTAWVTHTQEVLRETEVVISYLKDVETGDRGYVITGRDEFLTTYHNALEKIPLHLRRLEELTADNAGQQERVRALDQLTQERLDRAALFLKTADTAKIVVPESARQHIIAGKQTMDRIRALVGDMRAHEEMLLGRRAEESQRSSRMSAAIIAIGTLASFAILISAFMFLRREIGQRSNAERAAREHAAEVENLYDKAPCGYHSVDRNGVFVRMNETELSWLGYTREEVIGKLKFVDVVAPECVQIVLDNFPKLVSGKATVNLEYSLVRKDGTTFPVAVNAVPVLDGDGNYVMSRTTMFDITAMKEVESRLTLTNNFLDAVVENIPSMIFVKEAKTLRFARINKAEEDFLGVARSVLVGKTDYDFFPAEEADFFTAKDREVLQSKGVVNVFEEKLTTGGITRILRTRKIGLRDPDDRPQYLVGISDDITEQKRTEQAIRDLNASLAVRASQLEAANKELESFTYSVSHDLRAPLRAIDGFTRIFEEDYGATIDEEGRRLLKVIRDNSQRMGVLIDDLLAFSRLGRQPLATRQIEMNALVEEAVAEVRNAGAYDGAEVLVATLPGVLGDPVLLRQVWVNLLSNALKYSSTRASPKIEVGFIAAAKPHDHLTYFVKDNGVGFDMRYYDKLFGVFQRLHSVGEFPGTGVGLAIVHRVVTQHGGKVWAEAELDNGATFFFSLPTEGTT
jgi:PAS domain S-box-containing protein